MTASARTPMSPTPPPPKTRPIPRVTIARARPSAASRYTGDVPLLEPQKTHTRLSAVMTRLSCVRLKPDTTYRGLGVAGPLRDEFVPEAVVGDDVLRVAGIVFELLSEPRDVQVDGARRRHRVVAPDLVEQLVAAERGAAMFDEILQQLEFACREVEGRAGLDDLSATEVDGDVAKAKGLAGECCRRCRAAAAQERLDAPQELGHLERLDQVVVGAQLEADDAIDALPLGRQHQDRRLHAALAQRPADVETVSAGQHDVKQDRVEGAGAGALE